MSGIVGIVRWDGQEPSPGLVRKMAERIAHRGPDGVQFLDRENVSVGYLHLNVTPESLHEVQPLANEPGQILVADARIDNRAELLELLGMSSRAGDSTIPDSQLILAAYEKWQEKCLDHLIGDFAFVLWDTTTKTLFCGRDHSGVRPFFFHHVPGKYFLFASEIKALWAFKSLEKQIDDRQAANYLHRWGQHAIYQRNTFYREVNSLPPAHSLTVNQEGATEKMYWDVDPARYTFETEAEYYAAFKEIFLEAVRCRIRSPFPISSFLSGGLDSSSVAAVASTMLDANQKPLDTYYIDTQLEETSEREYVQAFLDKYPVRHRDVTVEGDYYDNLVNVARVTDMPEMFSLNYNHFAPIVRSVSEAGSRVLLTGSDGDSVVGYGAEYIYEAVAQDDWREAARRFKLSYDPKEYQTVYGKKEGKWQYAKSMISRLLINLPLIFGGTRAKWQLIKGALFYLGVSPVHLLRVFLSKFSRKNLAVEDYSVHPDLLEKSIPFMREGSQQHPTTNLLMNKGMLFQIMSEVNEYYDIMGAYHQVQICHPFFDKRLIELCMSMPAKLKFYEGYGRGPLRDAMKEYLPEKIGQRKGKIDFTPYVYHQMTELKRSPFAVIEENKELLEGYIVANKTEEELLAHDKETHWGRLHHRILYFLHWRKAQGI